MIDAKAETLLAVAQQQNFTRAVQQLSLTQPAVSHHIRQLEEELGVKLFVRGRGELKLTGEGEIVLSYAKRMKAMDARLRQELADSERHITRLRIGITHTSESNRTTEVLAKCGQMDHGISITIITE